MKKKLTALFLALVMCFTPCLTSFAAAADADEFTNDRALTFGDTTIDSYENPNGDIVLLQYVDGVLTQRNTVKANSDEIIEEVFKDGAIQTTSFFASDYVTTSETPVQLLSAASSSVTPTCGVINYRALYGSSYVYYAAECTYTIDTDGPRTKTFNNYVGTLVSLVSIFVSVFLIPEAIAQNALQNLLANAGITVAGGVLTSAFTASVTCMIYNYTWTLRDTEDSSNIAYLSGAQYDIIDTGSSLQGTTQYEGYIPEFDWGTISFAGAVHSELFDYLMWEIVSWEHAVYL